MICDKVGLSEYISSLKEGISTKIGERGVKISGGQKQRIAIAGTILNDSDIIVLDESTSALDNISQSNIIKNLKGYLNNKIVVIIAHRLSTIKNADEIIVINDNSPEKSKGECIKLKASPPITIPQPTTDIELYFFSKLTGCKV